MHSEPTPLALDNFRGFSSNAMKFSVVIENTVGCSFFMSTPLAFHNFRRSSSNAMNFQWK